MAYQENTGADPADVIDKIATFAAANGWTVHANSLSGSNRTLVLRKGGDYVQLWNDDTTSIRVTGFIGYAAGTAYNLQAGYAGTVARAHVGAGPFTQVYLFADTAPSDHVHVVIEGANGIFSHISFGQVDKLGTWTGGTYFDATWWSQSYFQAYYWTEYSHPLFDSAHAHDGFRGAVRCDIPADARADAWAVMDEDLAYKLRTGLSGGNGNQSTGEGFLTTQCYNRNAAPFSGQVTLGTIRFDVSRDGGFFSPAGMFPNVRYLTMERYTPGQEITVESDTWKVFPMRRKGVGQSNTDPQYWPFSNNHAFAFKKVA